MLGPKVSPSKKVLRSFCASSQEHDRVARSRNCQELNDYVEGAVDPKGRHVEIRSGPDARNKTKLSEGYYDERSIDYEAQGA